MAVFSIATAHAQTATTTTLVAAPTSTADGTVVTLTATVKAGATALTGGTVTFTDTYNSVTETLGTVQVQSANGTAGNAVLKQEFGWIGTHSIVAKFNPPSAYQASTSTAQSVTITGPYLTATSLAYTGTAGNYSLTATVVGAGSNSLSPTGSVSFQDTSNANYLLGSASLGAGTIAQNTVAGSTSPVTVGNGPDGVAAGDFNGDGLIDLAVLNGNKKTISILIGDGAGGFTASGTTYATGNSPVAIVATDFNGDGKLDLAVANSADGTISILLGNGDGTFKNQAVYTLPNLLLVGTTPTALAVGDFNGDGIPDIAVAGSILVGTVDIMQGDGTGAFSAPFLLSAAVGNGPSSIVVGDFNGDGKLDFAVTNKSSNSISVMLGGGNGTTFNQATGSPISTGSSTSPAALVAADLNGDGKRDLAVVESGKNRIDIFKGKGDGTFTLQPSSLATGSSPTSIVSGDFNSDGKIDLAAGNTISKTLGMFLGNGDLTFQSQTTAGVGSNPIVGASADFNGDGTSDLVVANNGSSTVNIFLNEMTDTASALLSGVSVPGGGTHNVDSVYAGDTNFSASTSNTVALTGTNIPTSTLLNASTTTPYYSQQVVFTATIVPALVGSLVPTGSVSLKDGATVIGVTTPSSGVATFNISTLSIGTHTLTAVFAGDTNYVGSTSTAITVTVGKVTPVITWANPASISYGTILWTTQLNAVASVNGVTVPGTYAYTYNSGTQAMGAILPVGTYTLGVTFTPTNTTSYNNATGTATIQVTQATPSITWPTPDPITFGTPLNLIQLNATAARTTLVPLASYYNVYGIYTNGTSYSTGGFDGDGNAYSANSLGSAINWNGVTYTLGPANAPDAVYGDGTTATQISLPAGYYATLNLLGAMVNNVSPNYTFKVTYTDGTTTSQTIYLSDWVHSLSWPGESSIKCNVSRDTSGGGVDANSTCVYGYQITLDPTKIVQSLTLPNNRNILMLAMGLTSQPVAGTFVYNPASGTTPTVGTDTLSTTFTPTDTTDYTSASASVSLVVNPTVTSTTWATPAPITYGTPLSSTQLNATATYNAGMVIPPVSTSYDVAAIFTDGTTFNTAGFANSNNGYSANQLGSQIVWKGTTFPLGNPSVPNGISSATVPLPALSGYTLYLLGAANGNQTSQPFIITYTDGSTATTNLSLSSWNSYQAYTGESIAATTTYIDTQSGGSASGTYNVYGYQITLDSTKTLKSITLPTNSNITILSMAISTLSNPATPAPGTYVYTPPAGTVLSVGTHTLNVVYTPTDTTTFKNGGTASVNIVVNKAPLTVTANNETAVYGAAVPPYTYTITGFVNGDAQATAVTGAPTLTTSPASPVNVGTYPISVALGTLASTNYSFTTLTPGTLTITKATPVITWPTPAPITYGTALSATQLNATATPSGGTFVYSPVAGTVLSAGTQTLSVTYTPSNANYAPATATVQLTVNKMSPTITWANPAPIPYGTALSATQLNATSSVAGAFAYSPAAGTILPAGSNTLSVTFTPTDTTNYATQVTTVTLVVNKATSTITWPTPAPIVYGTALSATQLAASSSVAGTFVYTPAAGSIPAAGNDTLSVTFTPTDTANYTTATATVTLSVGKATPVLTWSTPAAVPYGTALSGTQLDATSSVAGTFVYTPAAGAIPAAGNDTLSVTFTPTDTANYTTATATVTLSVGKATPVLTWSTPAAVPYGTALSGTQLDAASSVAGTFVYTPAAGAIPAAGNDTLSVTFTPTDTANYTTATATVTLSVGKATPVLTWSTPAAVPYGTALSSTQLDATSSVAGTFTYTPAAGAIPAAGNDTLSVTFTPTDTTNYTTATATVTLTVNKAVPVITWANPAPITYGTSLSNTQLNATSPIAGTFTYSPAAGAVPAAGTDTLTATFTPTDSTNYSTQTVSVTIIVNKAAPVITWSNPAPIAYGTALSNTQLNATSSVAGTFTYSPAAGAVPAAGTDTLTATFTPTDSTNYSTQTASVTIVVNKAAPIITWANPAPITYGTALSGTQLDATSPIAGTFTYSPAAGTVLSAGSNTLSVTFTPTDTTNYTTQTATATLVVNKGAPVITWATPAPITYGTALSSTQLDATASVAGSFVYTPAAGSIPAAGSDTLSVTFTPTDTANYTAQTASVTLAVNKATPVITWVNPAPITYGTALSSTQLDATSSVAGTFTYSPAAGAVPAAGTDTLTATFTPDDTTNYTTQTASVTIVVNKAAPVITWANPASITYGTALSATQLNATSSVAGTFTYTPAVGVVPAAGTDTLSATFTPDDTANYTTQTASVTIVVSKATPVITWANPAPITYGTALSGTQLDATSSVAGAFVYTPAAGTVLSAGNNTLSVTFTPTDTANYTTQTASVTVTVNKAAPVITWATPAPITYGTALSGTQLDATSSVAGAFVYTPAAGTVLSAGPNTLSLAFTPTDTANYTTATATVNLVVIAASPVINWSNPAPIIYGTPLSSTQLDATAATPSGGSIAGTFTYAPAAGTVLSVGTQPLTATFTPDDSTDYTTVKKTVTVDVQPATLIVTANDATKIYGTANPTFTGTITGQQNGDTFTESFSTTAAILSDVGSYAIVPAASGTNIANYTQTVHNGTLSITKASVVSTLSLSTINVPFEVPVTMTVTVKSATSGTPTGSVSFFDNGNLIGTAPIVGNTATFTSGSLTNPLPVGNNVISTLYSGDNNFYAQTAGASNASGTVQVTPLDFSMELTSPATLHGVYGTSGTYTFHIAPIGGSYPGKVVITVNGANGPVLATYTFSQTTIGMFGGPADITLKIATRKLAELDRPANPATPLGPIALGLFLVPLASIKRLRQSSRKLARAISLSALLLLTLGGIASLTGCGSGIPSTNDPIIITATSNGVSHSIVVNYHIDKSNQ
ncbi:beta strand repeat-containing protein [Edaphobacter sp.]|uniref:beta strand repeat-containing protein n=1 Tax=Edaphobacter sp. TaxID=1934404 RepID=UPI002DB95302|nr:FG-GAP-like repeat-containing protein [Edaphobacter sp.]HEU5340294.1 FG-GAP-like repeat-containing protein [Edaphobacter sp.]